MRRQPKPRGPRRPLTVLDYFFQDGDVTRPMHTDAVRRDELWRVLTWYDDHRRRHNTLRARLWRALRRLPSSMLNPFTYVRLRRRAAAKEEVQDG